MHNRYSVQRTQPFNLCFFYFLNIIPNSVFRAWFVRTTIGLIYVCMHQ